jgi:hypothetical protein
MHDRATHQPAFLKATRDQEIASLKARSRSVKRSDMVAEIAVTDRQLDVMPIYV